MTGLSDFFFYVPDPAVRAKAANLAFTMLSRQCAVRKSSRTIALRELLEGALFQYGHMFEATDDEDSSQKRGKQGGGNDLLLLKLNQRQGVSRTNVWHSGVIGGGVKAEPAQPTKISEELENLFLGAITACCKSEVSYWACFMIKLIIVQGLVELGVVVLNFFTGHANHHRRVFNRFPAVSRNRVARCHVQRFTVARRRTLHQSDHGT